jgi:two-component system chemotaxis response regulator CheB
MTVTVVVGSSAGGSGCVERLLADLPVGIGARVLVVQHMLDAFTGRFADRLDSASEYEVRETDFEDSVGPDEALVAKGDLHTEAVEDDGESLGIELSKRSGFHGLRPSVDATMSSVAEVADGRLVAVVLSGMGSDGVRGVEDMKEAGAVTVAQDEETCSVFGMPRRAIETGCVDHVVPCDEVAERVVEAAEGA